jgi:hypothetical protein
MKQQGGCGCDLMAAFLTGVAIVLIVGMALTK